MICGANRAKKRFAEQIVSLSGYTICRAYGMVYEPTGYLQDSHMNYLRPIVRLISWPAYFVDAHLSVVSSVNSNLGLEYV